MSSSWLSLMGLMSIYTDILDGLSLPPSLDLEIAKDTILVDTAELGLVYTDPVVLKTLITRWSARRVSVWTELEKTLHYDYNPIHNYDRTEYGGELETRDLKNTHNRTYTSKEGLENHEETNGSSEQDTYKGVYDSDFLAQSDKTTGSGEQTSTATQNTAKEDNDNINGTDTGTVDTQRTFHAEGNIGVTSTQDMIRQQREVVEFDIYHYISQDFKTEFCVMVY